MVIQCYVFIQGIDIQIVIVVDDGVEQVQYIFVGGCFIECNVYCVVNIVVQVNLQGFGMCQYCGFICYFDVQGVEVVGMVQFQFFFLQVVGQNVGQMMNVVSDMFQICWVVEYCVQVGDVGQQNL